MLDENALQESINRRLSGLCADAQRRARIRSRVRQPSRAGSRRLSPVLICLLTAALVTASVALAEHWKMFHLFGREEQRYAHVAEEAALTSAAPVTMEQAPLDSVVAQIDSAYYDGLTLHLAFSVAQGARYEAYTPSAEELAGMSELSALPVAIQHAQAPGADILLAYNQALQSATPFGYRAYTVYAGDHTTTDDGIDLPPSGGSVSYTEAGVYCEMREFASPLPDALDGRDVLHLRIQLYQSVQTVYFDGQTCYTATQRSEAGTLTASVPLSSEAPMAMAGTAQVGDILCTAEAEVSPMAAVITLRCGAPLETLLSRPAGPSDSDSLLEIIARDEQGRTYQPQAPYPCDGQTEVTFTLRGVGELPETLTLYAFFRQADEAAPEADASLIIPLYPVP